MFSKFKTADCEGEYRLAINGGRQALGTRRLRGESGGYIGYRLWQDHAAATAWGSRNSHQADAHPAPSLKATGSGSSRTYPVYGTLIKTTEKPAGNYSDVVRVRLSYPPYGPEDMEEIAFNLALTMDQACSLTLDALGGFGANLAAEENIQGMMLGQIEVSCASTIHYAIGIDSGQHF